ncbi:MAG: hypothetical protein SNJ55_12765 [Chloroherpetonaceae bacterium]
MLNPRNGIPVFNTINGIENSVLIEPSLNRSANRFTPNWKPSKKKLESDMNRWAELAEWA